MGGFVDRMPSATFASWPCSQSARDHAVHDDREKIEGISPDCQARDAKRLSSIRFCGVAFDFKDADSKAPAPRSHHRPRSLSTPKPVIAGGRMRSGSDIRPKGASYRLARNARRGDSRLEKKGDRPCCGQCAALPEFRGNHRALGPMPAAGGSRGARIPAERSSIFVECRILPARCFRHRADRGLGLIDTRLIEALPICGISNADRRIDRSPGSFCGPFIFRFEDEYPS